jgi:hypothetical protein
LNVRVGRHVHAGDVRARRTPRRLGGHQRAVAFDQQRIGSRKGEPLGGCGRAGVIERSADGHRRAGLGVRRARGQPDNQQRLEQEPGAPAGCESQERRRTGVTG